MNDVKVVAEVGSNFKTENDLFQSIEIAKQCGADVVKFQLFSEHDLYGLGSEQYNFNPKLLRLMKIAADRVGIELMCSAFSPGGYEIVNEFVSTHKIASCEISDHHILETVNSFKKPVIFSNGGSTIYETMEARGKLNDCPEVTAMWCAGDYPAKLIMLSDFEVFIREMSPTCKIGFSDHSIDVFNIPMRAKQLGALVIEKHVNFFDVKGPDTGHSLNRIEFEILCRMMSNTPGMMVMPPSSIRQHKRYYSQRLGRWVRPVL
jgi:sialic acid synthase SpsE